MMVAVAGLAVVLFAVKTLSPDATRIKHEFIPLEFLVLDAATDRPIDGASVQLALVSYPVKTGLDGRALMTIKARTAERSSWMRRTRSVTYGDWWLDVSAGGYKKSVDSFRDHTSHPRYHLDAVPPPIVIRLSAETTAP
jgi:hypothetical protein